MSKWIIIMQRPMHTETSNTQFVTSQIFLPMGYISGEARGGSRGMRLEAQALGRINTEHTYLVSHL